MSLLRKIKYTASFLECMYGFFRMITYNGLHGLINLIPDEIWKYKCQTKNSHSETTRNL
jgi:glycogen synthase